MGATTNIQWTEATWNPLRGCTRENDECVHCYAERDGGRWCGPGEPFNGLVRLTPAGPRWTGTVALVGVALYGLVRYRLLYNAYIGGGTIVLAVGTGLAAFGVPSLIYAAEFVGIALMFFGFWKATEWAKEHRKTSPAGGPPPATSPGETEETPSVSTTPK